MKRKALFLIIFSLLSMPVQMLAQKSNPEAPEEKYLQDTVMLQKKISTISIPFDIAMADIEKQINATIAGLIYEDDSYTDNNNDNFKCKVWKKDNIVITAGTNDIFNFSVPLKIWAEKGIGAFGLVQYKSTEFEVNMKFTTKFGINPDWSVSTQTAPNGFDWITKPVLTIVGIDVPIAGIIGRIIDNQHTKVARSIDEGVAKNFNLKPYILKAWNASLQPFVASEEYKTWVKITPIEIQLMPLKTVGSNVVSTIGLKVITETITGAKPMTPPFIKEVPNLKIVQSIPNDFSVALMSDMPFEEAAKIAKKMFVGKKYDFKDGKYQIELTDVDIFGSNDLLVIKADTKGSLKGSIYLKGIPVYDATKHKVVFQSLDYDLKTKNVLMKVANWFLEGKIAKMIQEDFGMPVDDLIIFAKQNVESAMNSDIMKGIKLNGKIDVVQPDKVYITPTGITAVVNAKGKMNLKIDGF